MSSCYFHLNRLSFACHLLSRLFAFQNLRRAVELSPNQGHEKYMYLAQLAESREAVDLYRCGIDVLKATLEV